MSVSERWKVTRTWFTTADGLNDALMKTQRVPHDRAVVQPAGDEERILPGSPETLGRVVPSFRIVIVGVRAHRRFWLPRFNRTDELGPGVYVWDWWVVFRVHRWDPIMMIRQLDASME